MSRRSHGSGRWLPEHFNDPLVQRAKSEGWRSRAVYILEELDQKEHLLEPGAFCLDLGSAPGSWSQYAARQVGDAGRVIATDMRAMSGLTGVEFVQGEL